MRYRVHWQMMRYRVHWQTMRYSSSQWDTEYTGRWDTEHTGRQWNTVYTGRWWDTEYIGRQWNTEFQTTRAMQIHLLCLWQNTIFHLSTLTSDVSGGWAVVFHRRSDFVLVIIVIIVTMDQCVLPTMTYGCQTWSLNKQLTNWQPLKEQWRGKCWL